MLRNEPSRNPRELRREENFRNAEKNPTKKIKKVTTRTPEEIKSATERKDNSTRELEVHGKSEEKVQRSNTEEIKKKLPLKKNLVKREAEEA